MHTDEIDQLAQQFGGRYRLTVLIQKRLKELVKGAGKLVDVDDRNLVNVVMEEIRQGKVKFEDYGMEPGGKEEGGTKKTTKKKE